MTRRTRKLLLAITILAAFAVPAAAEDFTGDEADEKTLQCPGPGQSVPKNQEPPGSGECGAKQTTYQGKVWDNDVKCKSGHQAGLWGALIYTAPNNDGVGMCNQDKAIPFQGRIVVQKTSNGATIYADGDK